MFDNRTDEMMFIAGTKDEFATKQATLIKELKDWFDNETAAIDGSIVADAPSGDGGSIIGNTPPIDSKRVLDATLIVEEVLGFELPAEIIQPGGYASFDEMVAHLIPQLEKIFVGDLKPKRSKSHGKTKVVEST
jgi:hypothetical protein